MKIQYALVAAVCAFALSACQSQRIDGSNQETFQHSIRTICKESADNLPCTTFQLRVQTIALRKGAAYLRKSLDGLTYSEAQARIEEMSKE